MVDESDLNKKRQELQHFLGKVKRSFWITLILLFSLPFLVSIFLRFISTKSYSEKAENQYQDTLKPYIKDIPEDQIENVLAEKCNKGDGLICGVLAEMYQRGAYVEQSHQKDLEYLKKGCDLNDLCSCRVLRTNFLISNRENDALEIDKKLCHELNQKDGCANIANLYLFNAKFSDKEKQGKEYLKALCDDKSEQSQHYCADFNKALEHREKHRAMSPASSN